MKSAKLRPLNLRLNPGPLDLGRLDRLDLGRRGRTALVLGAAAAAVVLPAACSSSSQNSGGSNQALQLKPASGATSSTPTWSTGTACAQGFQGSAILREVHSDGATTNSVSPGVNGAAVPFSGTLQADIARIQAAGGISDGSTQKLVVVCFSGPSLTGTSNQEMTIFITYSSDGKTYTTSSTAPAGS